jgi:hypothetical protein
MAPQSLVLTSPYSSSQLLPTYDLDSRLIWTQSLGLGQWKSGHINRHVRLHQSMVGATMNETLQMILPITDILKIALYGDPNP